MKTFTAFSFVLCLGSCGLLAQEANVSMRVYLVSMAEEISALKLGTGAGKNTARAFQYSQAISYSGPQLMEISQGEVKKRKRIEFEDYDFVDEAEYFEGEEPPKDEPRAEEQLAPAAAKGPVPPYIQARREETNNPELVALATLPTNSNVATVLMYPDSGGTFRTLVFDDDPSKLPYGHMRVHNLSPYDITLRFDREGQPVILKTGQSSIAKPKNDKVMIYELAFFKDDRWKFQERNVITVREEEQINFVVVRGGSSYFQSGSGQRSGFLQTAALRRRRE